MLISRFPPFLMILSLRIMCNNPKNSCETPDTGKQEPLFLRLSAGLRSGLRSKLIDDTDALLGSSAAAVNSRITSAKFSSFGV